MRDVISTKRSLGTGLLLAVVSAAIILAFNHSAGRASAQQTCVPPPANMVGWYPGDNNANDLAPSPDNGTLNGSATFAPGKVAQAFSLNGTTDYVSAPDATKLNFGIGDFSIDAWIKTSNANGVQSIVDKRVGDNATVFTGYELFTFNGNLGVQLADGTASNFVSASNVADGLFHHVAVTVVRNSATGGNLFVDGVSVLTFDPTGRPGTLTNNAELRIGRNSPNTILNGFFNGLIDEVELFSRALTAAEVQSIFNAGTAGKCKCSITCPANITQSNDPNQCGAVVTFPAPTVTGPCTATCAPLSGSFFPKGTTTVTCSTTDPSGNTFSCSFTVTVNDTQPPTITCPGNINAAATSSCPIATSAAANFTVTASDNCPGVTIACKDQNNQPVTSGQLFPVGTTTVTCTATDTSGNTATCAFVVTAFSFCLQDDSNPGNVVLVNAQTGDYIFCCGGITIASGRGTLTTRGCIGSIDHIKGDRKVHIQWDTSAKNGLGAGTAFVQKTTSGNVICQITDKNMSNNTCQCSVAPPPMNPRKPPKERTF